MLPFNFWRSSSFHTEQFPLLAFLNEMGEGLNNNADLPPPPPKKTS